MRPRLQPLHICAGLPTADRDAAGQHPAVAAHLAGCGPCADDLAGLLAALEQPPA